MAELAAMGFPAREAERALAAAGGDVEQAISALLAEPGPGLAARTGGTAAVATAGQSAASAEASPVEQGIVELTAMGFPAREAECALVAAGGNVEQAIHALLAGTACAADAAPGVLLADGGGLAAAVAGSGTASSQALPADRGLAELVAMGFPAPEAERALAAAGGDVEQAIHELLAGAESVRPAAGLPVNSEIGGDSTAAAGTAASSEAGAAAEGPPPPLARRERLYVQSPNGQTHIFGLYALVAGETANGMPLWRQLGGERWLYSDSLGRWTIGGARARELQFQCTSGFAYCQDLHEKAFPDEVGEGRWVRYDEEARRWCADEEISVTSEYVCKGRRRAGRGRGRGSGQRTAGGAAEGRAGERRRGARPSRGGAKGSRSLFLGPRGLGRGRAAAATPGPRAAAAEAAAPRQEEAQGEQQRRPAGRDAGRAAASASRPAPRGEQRAPPKRPRLAAQALTSGQALRCLGLAPSGRPTSEEVRGAYRRAALRWHPDRRQNHGREAEATQRFQAIRDAYAFLQGAAPLAL